MKFLRFLPILLILGLFNTGANAASVSPGDCGASNCWTDTDAATIIGSLGDAAYTLDFTAYPFDYTEGGSLAGSYQYSDVSGELQTEAGASSFLDCSVSCFLSISSGVAGSTMYLYDLAVGSLWNGTDDLFFDNFWNTGPGDNIAPSIALYEGIAGVSPVPVPAAMWLFGSALIGFIGFSRKRSV